MKRVVVTGMGIVSCIGNTLEEVTQNLKDGHSGISHCPEYAQRGLRSQIHGAPTFSIDQVKDRKLRRFMSEGIAWHYIAMEQAIAHAGLSPQEVSHDRTGLVAGTGGASTEALIVALDQARAKSPKAIGPFAVPKCMTSSHAAALAVGFGIRGVNYSLSSACATSAHCIGHGAELIQAGKQDIVFVGGGEELVWSLTILFDAMGALSSNYNDRPHQASRAWDAQRDGFVIAGGGGTLVLEELEHAKARGATCWAELIGYGATSDGYDMVQPSGEGAERCMRQALNGHPVDYINPHATSTPVGDLREMESIRAVFQDKIPLLSATKSLTGHSLGAAGVHEAIYTILMMNNNFICPSVNIESLDPAFKDFPIVTECREAEINTALSNSFGFGGTNASLLFARAS